MRIPLVYRLGITLVAISASLLLLNGGIGKRSRHKEPKQFFEMMGHPVLAYSIIAATSLPEIDEIIVNFPAGYADKTIDVLKKYAGDKTFKLIECGPDRQNSSYLLAQQAKNEQVLLHEAARPTVTSTMYQNLLRHASENVGYFAPIPFSVCGMDPNTRTISENIRRDRVFDIQLPQKFNRSTLINAHQAAIKSNKKFTEDAVLIFKMSGTKVHMLDGYSNNIKVTSPEDFHIVERVMRGKEI